MHKPSYPTQQEMEELKQAIAIQENFDLASEEGEELERILEDTYIAMFYHNETVKFAIIVNSVDPSCYMMYSWTPLGVVYVQQSDEVRSFKN